MKLKPRGFVNTSQQETVLVDTASNGIQLRRIAGERQVGTRVQQYRAAVAAVEVQRRLYNNRRADGATKTELDNIAARGRELRQYAEGIIERFYSDFREFGEYHLPRARLITLWAGHNDIGLYNSEVLVIELNTETQYYVQF